LCGPPTASASTTLSLRQDSRLKPVRHWLMTMNLQAEIEPLRARVAALEQKVSQLKVSPSDEQVIVLRSITRDQAKQEILELFQSGETLFFSDIVQRLRIDLPLVVEICQELREEGEIEVAITPGRPGGSRSPAPGGCSGGVSGQAPACAGGGRRRPGYSRLHSRSPAPRLLAISVEK
jgi:cell division protein FtsB